MPSKCTVFTSDSSLRIIPVRTEGSIFAVRVIEFGSAAYKASAQPAPVSHLHFNLTIGEKKNDSM